MSSAPDRRDKILAAAGELLSAQPYDTVSMPDIVEASGLGDADVLDVFDSMHDIGAAVLDHEGNSMRAAQRRAALEEENPVARLCLTFRLVGENLATDVLVRAGIRIAGESHHRFPERKINPFRTWHGFIASSLQEAVGRDVLSREPSTIDDTAWLLTAAGLGTKDLLMFTGDWDKAPMLLERTARQALRGLREVCS